MSEEDTTREFWVQEPGTGAIVEGRLGEPAPGDVVVHALYSGISRGTETLVFRGEVPLSSHERMRCPFQDGAFPGPVKYGYMSVGRVVAAGSDVSDRHLVGRSVFCLHPHQDRYVVPEAAVVPLPDDVPPARAVLAANMETAVNGVWDGAPSVGDRVVVVGAGVVGLLVGWLASKIPACEVVMVDVNAGRAAAAETLGLELVVIDGAAARGAPGSGSGLPPEAVDADLVIHASGSPEGLATALAAAGVEGRVVEMSWFGNHAVTLPLGERFHDRRLTLRSSQVGRLPPERAPRWTHRRRLKTALALLADDALDVLVTGESPFDALPAVMERLAASGERTLCHRIRYT